MPARDWMSRALSRDMGVQRRGTGVSRGNVTVDRATRTLTRLTVVPGSPASALMMAGPMSLARVAREASATDRVTVP